MKCNHCMHGEGEFLYQTINDVPINGTFKSREIQSTIPKQRYVVLCDDCYIKALTEKL